MVLESNSQLNAGWDYRITTSVGCTHGCGDAQRCTQSDAVRAHVHSSFLRISHKFRTQFSKFFQRMVATQPLVDIMDFFHSLCGFCIDPTTLLSPQSKAAAV